MFNKRFRKVKRKISQLENRDKQPTNQLKNRTAQKRDTNNAGEEGLRLPLLEETASAASGPFIQRYFFKYT
jgi:hypothetical protein